MTWLDVIGASTHRLNGGKLNISLVGFSHEKIRLHPKPTKAMVPKRRWLVLWIVYAYCRREMAAARGEGISPPAAAAAAAAPVGRVAEHCPLNIAYMDSHPWMVKKCFQPGKSHCCEGIMDIIRILLFSWLHATRSFLLPDNRTSAACLEGVQRHLESHGPVGRVAENCKLLPGNFTRGVGSCNKIENLTSFERAVDTSAMRKSCNGSAGGQFACHRCVMAMAGALKQLKKKGIFQGESNCALYVLMYAAGGINTYEELGTDAAYCILGAQNLPALAAMDDSRSHQRGNSLIELGVSIPVSVLVLLLCIYAAIYWRKHGMGGSRRRKLFQKQAKLLRDSVDASSGLRFFALPEIKASTRNFSPSRAVGEGGFSTVYRGTLANGSDVAVKRFKDSTTKGDADFSHEVHVISSVKHRNLLPLRGYCIGTNDDGSHEQLLVYDFMENGSLADYLFRRGDRPPLTWTQRHRIAVGIARALAYLHQDAKPAIIHRDVKAANVLLDGHLGPLVADFGLAKFKQDTEKSHYTTRAVGTPGYVAPEYALYGHLTDKTDVFSLGILLLELLTGRRALDPSPENPEHMLISDWACDLIRRGRWEEVIDERIRESGPKDIMERVILLALQCAHPRVVRRPSISQVQAILEGIDHPMPDIISALGIEPGTRSSGEDMNWLLSPDIDGRICYSSLTMDNISVDSYGVGR